MSRSYKHTPYCGDRKNKYMKRYANKRVRQRLKNNDYLPTAAEYKKMFESYDICDIFGMVIVLKAIIKKKLHIGINGDIDIIHFLVEKNVGKIMLSII